MSVANATFYELSFVANVFGYDVLEATGKILVFKLISVTESLVAQLIFLNNYSCFLLARQMMR